jgi:hypothetical protein
MKHCNNCDYSFGPCEYHGWCMQYGDKTLPELEKLGESHPLWVQDPYIPECLMIASPRAEAIYDLLKKRRGLLETNCC